MLQRIRASKWVRAGLLVVILGFCAYGLALEWPQVHRAIDIVRWYSIAGALGAAMASAACMMLAWRRLLADLGSKLPIGIAARVTFIAQTGKYLPGAIWSLAAHVELSKDYDVPRRRGADSVIIWIGGLVAVGLLIAAISLPLASPAAAHKYLIFLAAIPLIAISLAPPVLYRLLNIALRIIRQEPLEQQVSWRGLGGALIWMVIGWFLLGVQTWLVVADLARDGFHSLLIAVGAYALACSLALALVVFPNGIGAREVILVAALAPVLHPGAALAVALVGRVVTTVSDVAWGGIALAIIRFTRYSPSTGSTVTPPNTQNARRRGKHRKQAMQGRPTDRTAFQSTAAPGGSAEHNSSPPVPEVAA